MKNKDIKKQLLEMLESSKIHTAGPGHSVYTIDGLRLYDLIKGFTRGL